MKTLRQVIDNVNKVLEENFNKKVPRRNYNEYGEEFREVYSIYKVVNLIQKEFESTSLYITNDRNVITCKEASLKIKVRKKKSDIYSSWDYANQMTIVSIYVEDEELLDKTLDYFENVKKLEELEREKEEQEEVDKFVQLLKEKGISLDDFNELELAYVKMSYSVRKKIQENNK